MHAYLQTMERFLNLQQEVMQVFMNGGVATPSSAREPEGMGAEIPMLMEQLMANPQSRIAPTPHDVAGLAGETDRAQHRRETVTTAPAVGVARREGEALASTVDGGQLSAEAIGQTLRALVSEKTGYPIDMLDVMLNLEADLGVDSIKRVEILGAFQQQTGLLQAQDIERVSGLKTLQEVIGFFVQRERGQGGVDVSPAQPGGSNSPLAPSSEPPSLSFIGSVTSLIPGQQLVALYQMDLDEDLFLRDHTLGGRISMVDDGLRALPVVPLTIGMEMLAQAAAALVPGKLVVGMRDIRAHRWIALDEGHLTLELTARRNPPGSGQEVEVQIRERADPAASVIHPGTPMIEGTVVFGERYPDPARAGEFTLRMERPSKWTAEQLYTQGMFHGPCFQGVASVDRWGEDGIEATLKTMPTDHLLRSTPEPHFLADPVLLDAAGQLVGYWTAEHLETGFNVFPFRVEAVHIYGPSLPRGQRAKCRGRIRLLDDSLVRSDIDVVGPDGRLWAQLIGWEDRRFDLPSRFYHLRISPRDVSLSIPWTTPIVRFSMPEAFSCCLLDELSADFLEAHGRIWQRVLAHLVLSEREREFWRSQQRSGQRRTEWLLGRVAVKDAVRFFLKRSAGVELCPADVEIAQDEHGRPHARGSWTDTCDHLPVISLAQTDGIAVAIAGQNGGCRGIGIDIKRLDREREGYKGDAFGPEERSLLAALDASSHEEWFLRLWCAKEAVAKSLGQGMFGGTGGLMVQELDARSGIVRIALVGELAIQFPEFNETCLTAYTARERDLIVSSSLY
jgi:phosphopantetheinyl transferase/acyl carrier protein